MKLARSCLLVLFFVAPTFSQLNEPTRVTGEESAKSMTEKLQQAFGLVAEFEKTKDISCLHKALDCIGVRVTKPAASAAERLERRKAQTKFWLTFLSALERHRDPNFVLSPKGGPPYPLALLDVKGAIAPSGANPEDIQDPAARAKYVAAQKKYEEDSKRYLFQAQLSIMDMNITAAVTHSLRGAYTTSAEDQKELDELFRETGISPARQQKLKEIVEGKRKPGPR
jgi:hypothetical protein